MLSLYLCSGNAAQSRLSSRLKVGFDLFENLHAVENVAVCFQDSTQRAAKTEAQFCADVELANLRGPRQHLTLCQRHS
jgi:hypothetical protein